MKKVILNQILLILFIGCICFSCKGGNPPEPYGAIPTEDQLKWQQMEYYMFVHFGPNTFTNVEWGDGKEDPKVFNPTNVDCRQWAATAKAAGMKAIILTAKHHDGFCLWPSKYSTHTVRESLWKDGKGDLLKELSDACREYGLKFGVYLSPWDQNHPDYGTAEYNQVFANTLDEVLSSYGEVFEQWFDGANGGAHSGKKQVYDWDLFHKTVYKNQPHAIIFSDIGPGCRWMGNERGVAGETNWSTMNIEGFEPGLGAPPTEILNAGEQGGKAWVPAETDVSIRPGWFYSPETDDKVKSVDKLVDIYYTSIGRNSNLLLNVPPDRNGRIHSTDSTRLMEFRKVIEDSFKDNLMKDATILASNTRGSDYKESNMQDDNYDTYWASEDDNLAPVIEINFKKETALNRLLLQEYIPLGQRISSLSVEYWDSNKKDWQPLTNVITVGYKRILRFPTVSTSKIKIAIEALACPVISTIEAYKAPEQLSSPVIRRDKAGIVSISAETADPVIYYTTDGTEPTINSERYNSSFSMSGRGIVKAIAVIDNGSKKSEVIEVKYDIAPAKWTVISPESDNISKAIDGDYRTSAKVENKKPLIIDMGEVMHVFGFSYTPVSRVQYANIYKYNFYISADGNNWQKIKSNAVFNNIANNPVGQDVYFDMNKPLSARYLKMEPLETANGKEEYFIAELGIITR